MTRYNMNKVQLSQFIDFKKYPIDNLNWKNDLKKEFNKTGVISLPKFLKTKSVNKLQEESLRKLKKAYFNPQKHNVYLSPPDNTFSSAHPRNRQVISSKGCITDDMIDSYSSLRYIYNSLIFKSFLTHILSLNKIFPYADKFSSINIHYARKGEELGWHFDNSSFAITLMIKSVKNGGIFEYASKIRGNDISQDKEYETVSKILNDDFPVKSISMNAGGLLLFNGKNSMHRVTKVIGDETRILAVLAYNENKGVSLSKSAQKTFYGKVS